MKLRQTKIAHKMDADQAALRAADDKFTYSEGEMNQWLKRLLMTERGSEALFARFGLTPLRLSYEQITTAPPQQTITAFARHVGLPDLQLTDLATAQGKIGSDKNQEFANRFRESNAELIKRMDHERALRVAAVRMTAH